MEGNRPIHASPAPTVEDVFNSGQSPQPGVPEEEWADSIEEGLAFLEEERLVEQREIARKLKSFARNLRKARFKAFAGPTAGIRERIEREER